MAETSGGASLSFSPSPTFAGKGTAVVFFFFFFSALPSFERRPPALFALRFFPWRNEKGPSPFSFFFFGILGEGRSTAPSPSFTTKALLSLGVRFAPGHP